MDMALGLVLGDRHSDLKSGGREGKQAGGGGSSVAFWKAVRTAVLARVKSGMR